MTGLFRKRSPKEVAAIKNKRPDPKMMKIQSDLLQSNMEEGEVIEKFLNNKITPEEFQEQLMPIEGKRIGSVIEAKKTGFKVEKIKEE